MDFSDPLDDRSCSGGCSRDRAACDLRCDRVRSDGLTTITIGVYTRDSLFPGGVGNTFGDAAAFTTLIDQVEQRLFAVLPDATWFHPGHGDDSTLGAERPHLAEWRERGW